MSKNISPGDNVFVETPSHGFVEAKVTGSNKNSVSVKYVDEFIKET